MDTKEHNVRLLNKTGEQSEGTFFLNTINTPGSATRSPCHLVLRFQAGEFSAQASDFFEALCQIRIQIEPMGWRPVCWGCERDVYPSNMCRDMGLGQKAYRMQLGRSANVADLVKTFGTSPDVIPVSVFEQRKFYEEWMLDRGIDLKKLGFSQT